MRKVNVEGDGNCCFSAVASSLIYNSALLSEVHKTFLLTLEIDLSMNIQCVASRLRELTVNEWITNSNRYEGFLVGVSIASEAPKFLNPGYFHGQLGDCMVTALSNVLQISIIVFSSVSYHPFLCVSPVEQKISIPVMVAFTQFGPGHYDGVIPNTTQDNSSIQRTSIKCSCGKNDQDGGKHCHDITFKYTSVCRCPCAKNKISCTEICKCKNCHNNHGHRPSQFDVHAPKRKRYKHDWQNDIFKPVTSIKFINSKEEVVSTGPLTKIEFFCAGKHPNIL